MKLNFFMGASNVLIIYVVDFDKKTIKVFLYMYVNLCCRVDFVNIIMKVLFI